MSDMAEPVPRPIASRPSGCGWPATEHAGSASDPKPGPDVAAREVIPREAAQGMRPSALGWPGLQPVDRSDSVVARCRNAVAAAIEALAWPSGDPLIDLGPEPAERLIQAVTAAAVATLTVPDGATTGSPSWV